MSLKSIVPPKPLHIAKPKERPAEESSKRPESSKDRPSSKSKLKKKLKLKKKVPKVQKFVPPPMIRLVTPSSELGE